MDQINIFDLLPDNPEDYPDWHNMTLEQIAAFIGDKIGVHFENDTKSEKPTFKAYRKAEKEEYSLYVGEYNECVSWRDPNFPYYIGAGYYNKKCWGGASGPCDSLKEAVELLRRAEKNYRKQVEERIAIREGINHSISEVAEEVIGEPLLPYVAMISPDTNEFILYDDDNDIYINPPDDVLTEINAIRYASGTETEESIAKASSRLVELAAEEPDWLYDVSNYIDDDIAI